MEFEFGPHARLRMRRRQIPEDVVYAIVGDCDERIDRRDGVTEYFGSWEGRDLFIALRWHDYDETVARVLTVVDTNTRRWRHR